MGPSKKFRKYRRKPNAQFPLRKVCTNPAEPDLIELGEIVRTETKKNIIDMIYEVEGQLMQAGNTPAAIILSLLRRQFARGDIDQETLFYWLRVEGLV
jgi:hypothetical protein